MAWRTARRSMPHPLEAFVMKAFDQQGHHDGTSLGMYLAPPWLGRRARGAYTAVARDVLAHLENQGKLRRDERGWWVPVGIEASIGTRDGPDTDTSLEASPN